MACAVEQWDCFFGDAQFSGKESGTLFQRRRQLRLRACPRYPWCVDVQQQSAIHPVLSHSGPDVCQRDDDSNARVTLITRRIGELLRGMNGR